MSKAAVAVGGAVGKYGTKLVLGAGYIGLRAMYSLGEAGEAAIASGTVEAERLAVQHEAVMLVRTAEAAQRKIELQARMLALSAPAPAVIAAAPVMQPVVTGKGKAVAA